MKGERHENERGEFERRGREREGERELSFCTTSKRRERALPDRGSQGAQQPPATENLRETNVELREENPKTSPENLINTFCGAP